MLQRVPLHICVIIVGLRILVKTQNKIENVLVYSSTRYNTVVYLVL